MAKILLLKGLTIVLL